MARVIRLVVGMNFSWIALVSHVPTKSNDLPMPKISGYDHAVGPTRLYLHYMGIWPDPFIRENTFDTFRAGFCAFVMIFFSCIAQSIEVIRKWGDLSLILETLTTDDVPICVASTKFIFVWYNRAVLRDLVIIITEDWQRKLSKRDEEIMWKRARFTQRFTIVSIFLAIGTITAQFFVVVISRVKNENTAERPMYMSSYFPYNTQKSPNYEITWIGQFLSTVFAASCFSAVDALFSVLTLHLCGQLEILRNQILEIGDDMQEKFDENKFDQRIKHFVERHEYLNSYASVVEDCFNMMFLIQMLGQSIVICLQGYELVFLIRHSEETIVLQLIHMIQFFLCFSFSLFVTCYLGEELQNQSSEIDNAVYNSVWYKLPHKKTKLLMFLVHRSRKPLEITAGRFSAFTLQLYCSILKTSGGYLSMLLAVSDRLISEDK